MNFTSNFCRHSSALVAAIIVFVVAASVSLASPAVAAIPPVAMTINPSTGQAGVAANYLETFNADAAVTNGTISTVIPKGWTAPQVAQPSQPGYVVAGRGTCSAATALPSLSALPNGSTQVTVTGITCVPGSSLSLGYLDASAMLKGRYRFGPSSVQAHSSAASAPIASPSVTVTAGPTTHFVVTTASATRKAGRAFGITVKPEDAAGEVSPYSGTVAITSTDHGPSTVLPGPTLITAGHTFAVTLTTAGVQSITVTDTNTPAITGTLSGISVQPTTTSLLSWSAVTAGDPATAAGQYPVGEAISYTISAMDKYHNVTPSFAAKVSTSSSTDKGALLPAVYTFTPGTDHGQHMFQLTPAQAGNQTYTFTDVGNAKIKGSMTLAIGLAIAPHTALTGTVGVPFVQTFTAAGASGSVTWSAAGLPSWLSLDSSSGTLTGTPPAAGTFGPFTVTATDSAAHSGSWNYVLTVGKGTQTITITSDAPDAPFYRGPTYAPQATSTSTLGVVFSIDAAASGVCAIDQTGVVSFTGTGTCTVDANQPGDDDYLAAPQVQQSFTVTGATQSITLGTSAPVGAVVGGASYTPAGTASSGLAVVFTIDDPANAPCTITDGVVSFTATGTCTVDANQPGDSDWLAAPQVQQSITVASAQFEPPVVGIVIDPDGDTQVPVIPPSPGTGDCPAQQFPDGGCTINDLDGTVDNVFDASSTVDPNADPSQDTVSYHWALYYPPIFGPSVVFTDDGITGYNSPVLDIATGSLPELASDSRTSGDPFWRAELTVTIKGPGGQSSSQSVWYRFIYDSSFSLDFSTDCLLSGQFAGFNCAEVAPQLLPYGNQGLYFTSSAPSGAVVGGAAYTPTTASYSGLPVTLSIDSSSSGACVLNDDGTVRFAHVGTCTIDASQAGQGDWVASAVQQTFSIGNGTPTITFGARLIDPDEWLWPQGRVDRL